MTDLTPYIYRAIPLAPSKNHVIQRPSSAEGLKGVSNALDIGQ